MSPEDDALDEDWPEAYPEDPWDWEEPPEEPEDAPSDTTSTVVREEAILSPLTVAEAAGITRLPVLRGIRT